MRVLYSMPHPVTIVENSVPFMKELAEDTPDNEDEYDLVIHFQEKEMLKEITGTEYHIVDCYYSRQMPFTMKGFELWRCTDLDGVPYVHLEWLDEKHVKAEFLQGYAHYLRFSRHLLNLTGLENWLIAHHGFMLHASLISYKDQGILFSAASGTGKSTQADLWEKYEGAEILNGDRAGIIMEDGKWMAYGLPFAGSSGIYKNKSVEVKLLVMLEQGPENIAAKLPAFRAEMLMFPQIVMHRWDEGVVAEAMNIVDEFAGDIPVYGFACRPDEDAVRVIKNLLEL